MKIKTGFALILTTLSVSAAYAEQVSYSNNVATSASAPDGSGSQITEGQPISVSKHYKKIVDAAQVDAVVALQNGEVSDLLVEAITILRQEATTQQVVLSDEEIIKLIAKGL
ncbi:MAG: hypothetical protein OM95_02435 [Bdellovibrio sp. ArHS]|uniref:hypothetical protein n=1 Tax=Bdellovibrio sp. ArHS TaxID=1569284 RepID=UPI0005827964|nr:hypothetical protein [Bdellovibrio sp. ArHS]KHD89606.1 MAG: hypothetical protein OM95_02435 [Bdellovibrio sp. ArHS]